MDTLPSAPSHGAASAACVALPSPTTLVDVLAIPVSASSPEGAALADSLAQLPSELTSTPLAPYALAAVPTGSIIVLARTVPASTRVLLPPHPPAPAAEMAGSSAADDTHDTALAEAYASILDVFLPSSTDLGPDADALVRSAAQGVARAWVAAHAAHRQAVCDRCAARAAHEARKRWRAHVRAARKAHKAQFAASPAASISSGPNSPSRRSRPGGSSQRKCSPLPLPPPPPPRTHPHRSIRIPPKPPPWRRSLVLIAPPGSPASSLGLKSNSAANEHDTTTSWLPLPSRPLSPPLVACTLRPIHLAEPASPRLSLAPGTPCAQEAVLAVFRAWATRLVSEQAARYATVPAIPSSPGALLDAGACLYSVSSRISLSFRQVQAALEVRRVSAPLHLAPRVGSGRSSGAMLRHFVLPASLSAQCAGHIRHLISTSFTHILAASHPTGSSPPPPLARARDALHTLRSRLRARVHPHSDESPVAQQLDRDWADGNFILMERDAATFIWPASLVLGPDSRESTSDVQHKEAEPEPWRHTSTSTAQRQPGLTEATTGASTASIHKLARHTVNMLDALAVSSRSAGRSHTADMPEPPGTSPLELEHRLASEPDQDGGMLDTWDNLSPLAELLPSEAVAKGSPNVNAARGGSYAISHASSSPLGRIAAEGSTHSTYHTTPCTPGDLLLHHSRPAAPETELRFPISRLLPPLATRRRFLLPIATTPSGASMVEAPTPLPAHSGTPIAVGGGSSSPSSIHAKYTDTGKFALMEAQEEQGFAPIEEENKSEIHTEARPVRTKRLQSCPAANWGPDKPWISSDESEDEPDDSSHHMGSPNSDTSFTPPPEPVRQSWPEEELLRLAQWAEAALPLVSSRETPDLSWVPAAGSGSTREQSQYQRGLHGPDALPVPRSDGGVQSVPVNWVGHALSLALAGSANAAGDGQQEANPLLLGEEDDPASIPDNPLGWAVDQLGLVHHPLFNMSNLCSMVSSMRAEMGLKAGGPVALPPPELRAGLHTAPATLTLSAAALRFWPTLGLAPLSGPKEITSLLLVSSDASTEDTAGLDAFTATTDAFSLVEAWQRAYEVRQLASVDLLTLKTDLYYPWALAADEFGVI